MPTILPLRSATTALALTVPTCWADVTLAQFVALFAAEPADTRRPAEVLCGLPAGYLDNLAVDDVAYLANLLQFSQDPADVLALLPTPGLPSIGSLSFGTYLLAQQAIEANPSRPMLAHGPRILALYRTQLLYGKYDDSRVAACEQALLAVSVTESYADLSFFLSSWSNWQKGTNPTMPTTSSEKTRKRMPIVTHLLRSATARFGRWMRLLGVAFSNTKPS